MGMRRPMHACWQSARLAIHTHQSRRLTLTHHTLNLQAALTAAPGQARRANTDEFHSANASMAE